MKMFVRLCVICFLLCLNSVEGFLLDNSNVNGNKTATGNAQNQYITVDKFLQFELQQNENYQQLRNIMQQTFGLLSSQLNDKLKQMDAKINNNNSLDLELQHKYTLLEGNFTDIKRELSETQDKNRKLQEKLDEMAAKEMILEKKISTLEYSSAVQSQLNTSRLSERITNVEAKAMQLQQNQIARSQDFLAMYNDTIHLNQKFGIFENQFKTYANSTTDQIFKLNNNSHNQFELLNLKDKMIEEKLEAVNNNTYQQIDLLNSKDKLLDGRFNASFSNISDQMREISRKVALTACSSTNQAHGKGYIVTFEKIKTSVGITSTSSFASTGKFLCEYDGVYLVSADLTAYNTRIFYGIYVNGNQYEYVFEQDNNVQYQRGVISITLDLHRGDNIWIQLDSNMYVDVQSSCLTIVKIK